MKKKFCLVLLFSILFCAMMPNSFFVANAQLFSYGSEENERDEPIPDRSNIFTPCMIHNCNDNYSNKSSSLSPKYASSCTTNSQFIMNRELFGISAKDNTGIEYLTPVESLSSSGENKLCIGPATITIKQEIALPSCCHFTDDTLKFSEVYSELRININQRIQTGKIIYVVTDPECLVDSSVYFVDLAKHNDAGIALTFNKNCQVGIAVIYEIVDTHGSRKNYYRAKAFYRFLVLGCSETYAGEL